MVSSTTISGCKTLFNLGSKGIKLLKGTTEKLKNRAEEKKKNKEEVESVKNNIYEVENKTEEAYDKTSDEYLKCVSNNDNYLNDIKNAKDEVSDFEEKLNAIRNINQRDEMYDSLKNDNKSMQKEYKEILETNSTLNDELLKQVSDLKDAIKLNKGLIDEYEMKNLLNDLDEIESKNQGTKKDIESIDNKKHLSKNNMKKVYKIKGINENIDDSISGIINGYATEEHKNNREIGNINKLDKNDATNEINKYNDKDIKDLNDQERE